MFESLFRRLAESPFRSRFALSAEERAYTRRIGMTAVAEHAAEFIRTRLAAAQPHKDGEQTPMRGHPVFVAQHACGCCCRSCLAKWHGIPQGRPLTPQEQDYIAAVLLYWIEHQMALPEPPLKKRRHKGPQQTLFGFMEEPTEQGDAPDKL